MPKRSLYWFRNDLRLHDNNGLTEAIEAADEILPVFVLDPRLFNPLPPLGIRKTGIYRANFLIDAITDLRQSLRAKGGDLIIRVGHPARVIAQLAEESGADVVYASKEVTHEEINTESDLSKRLKPINVDLELVWMATLYHVRDLPFSISRLPDQFTQFREQVEGYADVRPTLATPASISLVPGIDPGELPTLATFDFPETSILPSGVGPALSLTGGEAAALDRLNRYIWEQDLLKRYKETRNGLLGEDYSTKFSAWLALGCLSPRLIYQEVKRYEADRIKNDSTYWLLFELLWRDFFRFVALRYGTRIFKPSGIRHDLNKTWNHDLDLFKQWTNGETGIPFIDANMRELNATGFMSNRGRQNVASFLINDLGIDWTWGASYFESLLVDYDPCNNWGNWNYMAGVGNDPRSGSSGQSRYFNILSQANRYDESGAFVKHWLPELAQVPGEHVHSVYSLAEPELTRYAVKLGETYPLPIINPGKWTTQEKNR